MQQLIHAVRYGQGGKQLVLIHGNMASANWWRPVGESLSDSYTLLAVDLRGFGDSPDTPEQVTLADHAKDIYDLVQQEGLENFVLVGHSLGGGVAMQFAAQYPDLLAGLVLVDSAPVGGMKDIDYNLLEMVVNNKELSMASLKGTLTKVPHDAFLNELLADGLRSLPAVIPNTRALDGADFKAAAASFAKPVLVIHGSQDILMPLAESEKTALIYPQAMLTIIPDVGHSPQVEDTATFVAALEDFINKL